MPCLIVNSETYKYKLHYFVGNISIGRHSSNDIILDLDTNLTISRKHAEIRSDGKAYTLIDSSLNGTLIENEVIKKHRLRHGDKFQIADYFFTFIDDTAVELADKPPLALNRQPSDAKREEKTVMRCATINEDRD